MGSMLNLKLNRVDGFEYRLWKIRLKITNFRYRKRNKEPTLKAFQFDLIFSMFIKPFVRNSWRSMKI